VVTASLYIIPQDPNRTLLEEDKLISLLKSNNEKAFHYLYDHYSGAIYGTLLKMVRDESIAQDLMQEVFTKVWNHIGSFRPDRGRLFTWMMQITRHTAIDKLRSNQSRPNMEDLSRIQNKQELSQAGEQHEYNIDITKVLNLLTPERKNLIDMIYLQGYTQEETAALLELPLGTVKTKARSALQELKKYFTS
jgi:RNA polymerase sigma factor (sigma-70 family)